ncbi:phosphotransferase [Solihabitans fulvus]|uniref:Phosphotransferase n=1 Tax=Solihabitans fulvus TaxID=1892852 RepID=A0A5B2XJ16_9PSEU|nr:phosphotransferase [Solihabitans fulvus]KAA2263015.1 phosphotransferase [Solihabitans fulvus]
MTSRIELAGGWDSAATLVDGRWIERTPRRPEVADALRVEARLMPWLSGRLPLPVPVPEIVETGPLVARHPLIAGEPADRLTAAHGRELGRFLRALHDTPIAAAVALGLPDASSVLRARTETLQRFQALVLPRLPADRRAAADALLTDVLGLPCDTVVHADLGPEHILVRHGDLSGVIDWSDAHVDDAALDLGWVLHGTPPEFAAALAEAYGATEDQRRRGLLWHRLGPWFEVVHGLDTDQPELVGSGVAGVLDRL